MLALVAVAARQHDGGSRQQDDHSYDGDADDIAAGAADCGTDFRLGNRLVSRLGIRLGVGLVVVRLRCWLEFSPAMASVSCLTAASASAWVAFSSFSTLEAASTASANFLALASV